MLKGDIVMTDRIQILADMALEKIPAAAADYQDISDRLLAADDETRLKILSDELPALHVIDRYTLIAGSYPFFRAFRPGAFADLNRVFQNYTQHVNKLLIHAGNHKTADFSYVIRHGMRSYLERIHAAMETHQADEEKLHFLRELEFACRMVLGWTRSFATACLHHARSESDPVRKSELLEMARICQKVPYEPAETFHEAIQSYFFVFSFFPDGVGRLDQYLYPCYQRDLETGRITRAAALELIENLFLRIFSCAGIQHEWSGINHGVAGGYTQDGASGHNECTSLVLEAVCELPTWRPQISYRVTRKTTAAQMAEVVEANVRRPDLVLFLNDDVLLPNLENIGIPFRDAVEYSVSGCNELLITGRSHMSSLDGIMNIMHSLDRLWEREDLSSVFDFDSFYRLWEASLAQDIAVITRLSYERDKECANDPDLTTSLFTDGCIESALPVTCGGAKYNYCTWCLTGLVNLADSMNVIRQMVFAEKRFSLTDMRRFLLDNWQGHEQARAHILRHACYFGNDNDAADAMVNRIACSVSQAARPYTPYRGGQYIFGTLVGYELAHVVMGKEAPASADGRFAGDPFAASISPFPGADISGVTAYLRSAAKLDGHYLPSSVVVNLALDRKTADTPEKRQRLAALFMAYFRLGGVQLQINYLSADELIRAQQNPACYRSLRVRVTGFSGFFTTFNKDLQDELIHRSLHQY